MSTYLQPKSLLVSHHVKQCSGGLICAMKQCLLLQQFKPILLIKGNVFLVGAFQETGALSQLIHNPTHNCTADTHSLSVWFDRSDLQVIERVWRISTLNLLCRCIMTIHHDADSLREKEENVSLCQVPWIDHLTSSSVNGSFGLAQY